MNTTTQATTKTPAAATRAENQRIADVAEANGFPYEPKSPAQLASCIASSGPERICVVATVEGATGKGRTFLGYYTEDEAPAAAAAMRRRRSIRVTQVAVFRPLAFF